jgi:hypothetical protein
MAIQIPIGPFSPDTPDYDKQSSLTATNVIPASASYRPFPSFAAITNSLTARAQGLFFARKSDGTGTVFAGDATKLYQLSGTTWSNVSRLAGGAYTIPGDAKWAFTQFGNNVYASDGIDAMQVFNVDSAANFSAATGSPPMVLYSAVAGDFMMVGNLPQVANTGRNTIQWSSINDPTASWAASQVTQASSQVLPDGGWIQGLVGFEYSAVVFQEFAIRQAIYDGVPLIFRFSKVTESLGCDIPGSVASYRDLIFFHDRSGFYMLQGGTNITPIGEQRVNNYFNGWIDKSNLFRVYAAIDAPNSCYIILGPDSSASNGNPNRGLVYNWAVDRWAELSPGAVEIALTVATQQGYTLEGLDAISTNLDTLPFSLDSQVYAGIAQQLIGGFDTTHAFGFFNGANLAATVDTLEANISGDEGRALVTSARPIVDGGTPTLAIGTRNRIEDARTFGSDIAMNTLGTCPQRAEGRYHTGRIKMAAGATWTHIQGVSGIKAKPVGSR